MSEEYGFGVRYRGERRIIRNEDQLFEFIDEMDNKVRTPV